MPKVLIAIALLLACSAISMPMVAAVDTILLVEEEYFPYKLTIAFDGA